MTLIGMVSDLKNANPSHNADGAEFYTWRNDNSGFQPGILDYVIYTDSVLDVGNQFVLNTVSMSSAERAATGLQAFDVTVDSGGSNFDHLPLVVDFRLPTIAASDFDFSRSVDGQDLAIWEAGYAVGSDKLSGDANGDSLVNGLDFIQWQAEYTGTAVAVASVPEPFSLQLLLLAGLILPALRR